MRLLLVRHGVAVEREPQATTTEDDERALTESGARKMRKGAKALAAAVHEPSLLLVSPLRRALETSAILRAHWPDVEQAITEVLRPETRPQDLASFLTASPVADQIRADSLVVIVGHEPHLTRFANWVLTGRDIEGLAVPLVLKKGGACLLEVPYDTLTRQSGELAFKPGGLNGFMHWLLTPSMLRQMR